MKLTDRALVLISHNPEVIEKAIKLLQSNGIEVAFSDESPRYLSWGLNRVIASDTPLHGIETSDYTEFVERTVEAFPWLSPMQIAEYRADVIVNDLIQEIKNKK